MRRYFFKFIFTLFFGILISGLLLELFFVIQRRYIEGRANRYREKHHNIFSSRELSECYSESIWEKAWVSYKPGASLERKIGGTQYSIKINKYGFRTKEFSQVPDPGIIRIICIGGSTTVQGESNYDTYPALLEELIRERFPNLNVEVLNFGVSSTPSYHWLLRMEWLLAFKPHILIQYDGINDICLKHFFAYGGKHRFRRFLNRSRLFQRLFPMKTEALDEYFGETHEVMRLISEECKKRRILYFTSGFPAPNPKQLDYDFKCYLDVEMAFWGGWPRDR